MHHPTIAAHLLPHAHCSEPTASLLLQPITALYKEEKFITLDYASRMAGTIHDSFRLIGVVVGISLCRGTNGHDLLCTLLIVDKTCFINALEVKFFAPTVEDLPRVNSFGDILVITGIVKTKLSPRGRPYISYSRRQFAYALFDGNPIDGRTEPYFRCLEFSQRGNVLVQELVRQFRYECNGFHFGPGVTFWVRNISSIEVGIEKDLICKVLHVNQCLTDSNQWELFVWDGSDAPPTLRQYDVRMRLPTVLIPNAGSILIVRVPRKFDVRLIASERVMLKDTHLIVGKYVMLKDITWKLDSSGFYGSLCGKAKIRFMTDSEAPEYLRYSNETIASTSNVSNEVSHHVDDHGVPSTNEVSHHVDDHGVPTINRLGKVNPDRKKNGPGQRTRKSIQRRKEYESTNANARGADPVP